MNIILLLILFHYVGFFFQKKPASVLACGIFGWTGRNVEEFGKDKFNLLGMANQSRGRDSCGIGANGKIFVGIDSTKKYEEWLKENYHNDNVFKLGRVKSIIGHTRNSSHGAINAANAHPFGFGKYNKMHSFMGVHNGTIYNKEDIAKEFDIKIPREPNSENVIVDKIDSEILLEAIYRSQNFKVLSMYNGGAAIAFINTKTPSRLYLFKGESTRHTVYTAEERPLYVYKENKNSLYFSSLKEPLQFIGGDKDSIIDIKCNIVYEIHNGDFEKAKKFTVSREKASQVKEYVSTRRSQNKLNDAYKHPNCRVGASNKAQNWSHNSQYRNNTQPPRGEDYYAYLERNDGFEEIPDDDTPTQEPYMKKLKDSDSNEKYKPIPKGCLTYKRNLRFYTYYDQLADGTYCFFPGRGFELLSLSYNQAVQQMARRLGKYYVRGRYLEFNDLKSDEVNASWIPYPKLGKEEHIDKYLYFFSEGIMLKNRVDLIAGKINNKHLTVDQLSHMSVFPVKTVEEYKNKLETMNVWLDGKLFSGKIKTAGGNMKVFVSGGVIQRFFATRELTPEYGGSHTPDAFNQINPSKVMYISGKTVESAIDKHEENKKLNEFNKMANIQAQECLANLVLHLDVLSKQLEEFSSNDSVKVTETFFGEIEKEAYELADKLAEK